VIDCNRFSKAIYPCTSRASLKIGIGIALTELKDRAILTYPGSIDATQAQDVDETLAAGKTRLYMGVPMTMTSEARSSATSSSETASAFL
jgi:hypothetical protein